MGTLLRRHWDPNDGDLLERILSDHFVDVEEGAFVYDNEVIVSMGLCQDA